MKTRFLSPEERPEHDMLMREAGYDPITGNAYPAAQIKDNLDRFTLDAVQAGRKCFEYIRADAMRDGLLKHWNSWDKEQSRVRASINNREVRVSGRRGSQQRDEDGKVMHQRLTWVQMSWDEVFEQDQGAVTRIAAEQITRSIAAKLAELRALAPDSYGPEEAAAHIGTTVDAWLMKENA